MCNCGKNRTRTAVTGTRKVVLGSGKESGCMSKYDEVSLLDRRAIALHKKFRFSQTGYRFMEMQKVTRGWMTNIKNECPDEDQLNAFTEYINSEYVKYFGNQKA